jgi:hypothetical protein
MVNVIVEAVRDNLELKACIPYFFDVDSLAPGEEITLSHSMGLVGLNTCASIYRPYTPRKEPNVEEV